MIPIAGWVAPFGYPRIKACSRLPMAFRSVPRPSSPPGAKASTECPSRAQTTRSTMHRNQPHTTQHRTMHGDARANETARQFTQSFAPLNVTCRVSGQTNTRPRAATLQNRFTCQRTTHRNPMVPAIQAPIPFPGPIEQVRSVPAPIAT